MGRLQQSEEASCVTVPAYPIKCEKALWTSKTEGGLPALATT